MIKINKLIISGIYSIRNITTNKCYIGQSQNIYMRLGMHLTRLVNNKHRNRLLQEEWNIYNSNSFEFELLEECSKEELETREIYYINQFADYNIRRDGYRLRMSDYSRHKMSKSRIEGYKNGTILKITKTIHKYDLDGNYLESYNSLREAADINKTLPSTIVRSAKTKKSCSGFMWSYEAKEKIEAYINMRYKINKDLVKLGEFMETPEVDNHELSISLND